MAAAATAAAWPTVPPLCLVAPAVQLELPNIAAPAAVWERRHVGEDGGAVAVVRIARAPDGSAWRVSFGLVYPDVITAGEPPERAALDVSTFGAARAAADAFALALVGACRAEVRRLAVALAAGDAAAHAAGDARGGRGQLLQFERPATLAPTG